MADNHPKEMAESAAGRVPEAAAPEERRHGARHIAVLRVAVLLRGELRQLCLVRNISPGGLMARVFCDLEVGDRVAIELRPDRQIAGRVVWTRETNAGVQFDEPIEVAAALAPPSLKSGWRSRMPRLEVDRLAMVRSGADISFASARDISQGGVRIHSDRPLRRGAPVVLTLEGFRPVEGVVRWQHEGYCGISFNQVIPPGDLSRWLAS